MRHGSWSPLFGMKPWVLSALLLGALVLAAVEPRLDRGGPTADDLVPVRVAIDDDETR